MASNRERLNWNVHVLDNYALFPAAPKAPLRTHVRRQYYSDAFTCLHRSRNTLRSIPWRPCLSASAEQDAAIALSRSAEVAVFGGIDAPGTRAGFALLN